MIRTVWFYLIFIPASLFFSCLAAVSPLFRDSGRTAHWCGVTWSRISLWAAGVRVETDLAQLPDGPCIVMANHQSQLDIIVLYAVLRGRRIGFVAKDSLFRTPLFGSAMFAAGHVPIDRSNRRKAMESIDKATQQAARGVTIVIFPEGTRSTDFSKLQEFKTGGFIMALKSGLPVVPIIINGSGPLLPKGSVTFPAGPKVIRVRALAPVESGNYTLKQREQLMDSLYKIMNSAYLET